MAVEEVHLPVVNTVRDILRHLFKEGVVPDSVKGFTKIKSDDDGIGLLVG